MAVTLTEKAAEEIKRIRAESQVPEDSVLRVGVRAGGCSGWDYAFNFDEQHDSTKCQRTVYTQKVRTSHVCERCQCDTVIPYTHSPSALS